MRGGGERGRREKEAIGGGERERRDREAENPRGKGREGE